MELDRVRKFLFEKVKNNIIRGKITGLSELPSDEAIEKEINNILSSSSNGIIGSISTFGRKTTSDPNVYGNNFLTIKDNIEYILGEVFDSLNNTIDIINNSVLEKNQILRDLKMIDRDFSDIEAGTLHNDGMKYLISDSFTDTDKIDTVRTTTQLNLNAGTASLNTTRASYIGFPHYRNQTSINFTITEGISQIVKQQQSPETKFGNIFDGDDTDRWELIITTLRPTVLEGYFNLKLSEIGASVEINRIKMKFSGTKDVTSGTDNLTFFYMNQDAIDKTWKILPDGKLEIKNAEIDFQFPTIQTTHIRVMWTKYEPDDVQNLEYLFSITELNVQKTSTAFESTLISNSMKLTPYQNEQPTIFTAELDVDKQVQPGTNIEFYIGIDNTIPGKVVDANSNVVDIDAKDAVAFVPNGIDSYGNPENYYTFASLLRDHPYLSGTFPYQDWQPKWQQLSSIKDIGTALPNQLYFNVSDFDKPVHDLYYKSPVLWGDPAYTGPWPVTGADWADNWDGTPGAFPKSGYIWGEDPLSSAGVWWGDSNEYPGWWRPMTPSSSGIHLSTPMISIPDFIIPVYDVDGTPVLTYDPYYRRLVPLQKKFWKIFKWPSSSLPIPGTIKLSNKHLKSTGTANDNRNTWKWNYKSKKTISDYVINFTLPNNVNFYTIKLEEFLPGKSDIRILVDSIRDVKFLNITPSEITDFQVEYGFEYDKDENGLYYKVKSPDFLDDAHVTIVFADSVIAQRRALGGDIKISLTISYEAKTDVTASWDGYLLVPDGVTTLPVCHLDTSIGSVNKITVQQINDNGLVQQTKSIEQNQPDPFQNFSLYTGLNLVRIFVDVLSTQDESVGDELATWRPDQYLFDIEETIKMQGKYSDPDSINFTTEFEPNIITNKNIDFLASGIVEGVTINVQPYTLQEGVKVKQDREDMVIIAVTNNTITLLPSVLTSDFYVEEWSVKDFTKRTTFTYDENITTHQGTNYLRQVDINVLLYETPFDDDTKYALLDDVDGSKYIVVKSPDPSQFPRTIRNIFHFTRTYWDYLLGQYVTFTTGTSGNTGASPNLLATAYETATSLVNTPANTFVGVNYPNVSTYGQLVNVTMPNSSGFLFWDTAENLEVIYDIKYSLAANNRPADRIFLMAKFISSDLNLSPVLNSYSLIINNMIRSTNETKISYIQ